MPQGLLPLGTSPEIDPYAMDVPRNKRNKPEPVETTNQPNKTIDPVKVKQYEERRAQEKKNYTPPTNPYKKARGVYGD